MGGMRALQTGTAKACARFTAGKTPQIEMYPQFHDLARKIMLAGNACEQRQHTSRRRSSIPPSDRIAPVARPAERTDQNDRGRLGWRILRVRGRGMVPTLDEGDHVLLKRYGRFRRPRPGDVACIRRSDGPMLIKRLVALDRQGGSGCPAMVCSPPLPSTWPRCPSAIS